MVKGKQQVGRDLKKLKEAWEGVDFIMELFEVPRVPRTVLTATTTKGQRVIRSRDEAMTYFEAALYENCYMNAYLDYETLAKEGQLPEGFKPVPNHIIIDLDRKSFSTDEDFQTALQTTLQNIKENFTGIVAEYPIVIWSGNGYHIHVPLPGWTTALEDIPGFAAFKDDKDYLPDKFLRWAERTLSNGSADPHHNPSIKSALFRVPGTINTKAKEAGKDPKVRIVQGMEYVIYKILLDQCGPPGVFEQEIGRPKQKFFNDFLGYLIQDLIDEKVVKLKRRRMNVGMITYGNGNNNNNKDGALGWIEQLLKKGVEDGRKNLIYWVLAPYLITIKGMDYDNAYHIVESWHEKCNGVRSLDPDWHSFRYRIRYCLDTAEDQERKPIRFETFKEYYPDVYKSLKLSGGS
jgi:hypothetical protein